jgi:hypothetical protein
MPGADGLSAALAHSLLLEVQPPSKVSNSAPETRLDKRHLPGMPGEDGLSAVLDPAA